MLCKHCGYQINEGESFCQKCGANVAEQMEQENVAMNAEQPVTESAENAFAEFAAPVTKMKKSRKRGWLIAAISTGAVAVLLAAAIFLGPILFPGVSRTVEGWARKTFGSADDYLQFVEEHATTKAVDGVVSAYGKYLNSLGNMEQASGAAEMSVKLRVGDTLSSLLEDAVEAETGAPMDLDWFKSISLAIDTNMKDTAGQFLMALNLNDKQIANADLIMDMDKGAMYLALLPLSEKYLNINIPIDEEFKEAMAMLSSSEMKNVLPSTETVELLAERYSKLVYENLKDAEKSTETVKVADVEQKLTVLKVQLKFKTFKNIAEDVLDSVENDQEIKKIIENFADYLEKQGEITNADEVYESFLTSVKEAKTSLKDLEPGEEGLDKIGLSFYVNGSHEIVGMKYKIDSDSVRYVTVRDGDDFAYELDAANLQITGTGTEKDDVVNGEYKFEAMGKEILTITMEDLSQKDDLLNGKIVVTPADDLLKDLGMDATSSSVMSLVNPTLEFVFKTQTDSAEMEINLNSGKELLVGITIGSKEKAASDITMPDSSKVIPEAESEKWLQSFDITALQNKLIEAGIPRSLLEAFLNGMQQEMQGGVAGI